MSKNYQEHVDANILQVNEELRIYVDKRISDEELPFYFELESGEPGYRDWDDNTRDFATSTENIYGYADTYKLNLKRGELIIGYTVIVISNFHLYDNLKKQYIRPRLRIFIDSTEIQDRYKGLGISKLFTYFHVSLARYLTADIVSWDQIIIDDPRISRYLKYGFNKGPTGEIIPTNISIYDGDDDIRQIHNELYSEFEPINNILYYENANEAYTLLQSSIHEHFVRILARQLQEYAAMEDSKYNYYSKYLQVKLKYIILKNLISKN